MASAEASALASRIDQLGSNYVGICCGANVAEGKADQAGGVQPRLAQQLQILPFRSCSQQFQSLKS